MWIHPSHAYLVRLGPKQAPKGLVERNTEGLRGLRKTCTCMPIGLGPYLAARRRSVDLTTQKWALRYLGVLHWKGGSGVEYLNQFCLLNDVLAVSGATRVCQSWCGVLAWVCRKQTICLLMTFKPNACRICIYVEQHRGET